MSGSRIKEFLGRAFDIREGEIGRVLLMQLNIFLIITSLLIMKPTVNGLFVSRFGADGLPNAYILVAVLAVIASTLYSRLMNRSSLLRMIIGTFVINVIVLAGFGLLLQQVEIPAWELYLIYVWVAVFGVFSASQFWILANLLFNIREAKRLFGFIGAGAIIGGILGGYITHLLAPLIGSENMIFLSAALLSLCIPITIFIWMKYVKGVQYATKERQQLKKRLENPVALIRKSKHLAYLAVIIGVSVIVAKLVDYQYSDIAAQNIPDKDRLTAFFGFWFSNFSIISLLFQLFLTRLLLGKLGVGGALFFLPGGIIIGATALLFFPELWAAILIKTADGSLKQSVNKAAIELLGIPIPLEIKKRTKTFIDVVVDSIATGIGGLVLIFLVRGLNLPTAAISLMIIVLSGVWLYFSYRIRKEYLQSFRVNILNHRKNKKRVDVNSSSLSEILKNILGAGEEEEIIWILKQIREFADDRFFDACRRLVDHPSAIVRAEAIRTLDYYRQHNLSEQIWKLTEDPDPRVKIAAFDYLVSFDQKNLPKMIEILTREDTDYRVRGPVLVSIASETSNNVKLRETLGVDDFVRNRIELIKTVTDPEERQFMKKTLAKGIGKAGIPSFFPVLDELLDDPDPVIVHQAILGAGDTCDPRFIKKLATFLKHKDTRGYAIRSLVSYGPIVLEYLEEIVKDPEVDPEVVKNVTEVAERLETPEAVDFLFELCDSEDQGVQIEALRSLTDLKRNYPHLKFDSKVLLKRILNEAQLYQETISILYAQIKNNQRNSSSEQEKNILEARKGLIHLLEHRRENHLERIFRLLGLKYTPDDFSMFFKDFRDQNQEIKANTIEFLDNLLHPSLKKVVMPIVESAMTQTITEDLIHTLQLDIPQEKECFQMLLDNKDVRVKLAIFYLIEQIDDPEYLPYVEPFIESENPKVKDYASRVYKRVSKVE